MNTDIKRLIDNLNLIGNIGICKNGRIRTAFSNYYFEASKKLMELMKKAGLEVYTDKVGNVHGIRKGKDTSLPSIIVGSHLDTVPNGGLYDGCLGVIYSLELMSILNENNVELNHTIHMVAFNSEEANVLGGTFGSRVLLDAVDFESSVLRENLCNFNIDIDELKGIQINKEKIKCFLEPHIEQGRDLYEKNTDIGIVNGIFGIRRYSIEFIGESNHAGTTPMRYRNDALVEISKLIIKINEIAKSYSNNLVATVGKIEVSPNSENVIPGTAKIVLEIRSLENTLMNEFMNNIEKYISEFKNVKTSITLSIDKPPVYLNKNIMKLIEESCIENSVSYQYMPSGAGHDAKTFAQFLPTGMIFIPSEKGISHCAEEFCDDKHIEIGMNIFLNTVIKLDSSESI